MIFKRLLTAYLILCPTFAIIGMELRAAQEIFFQLASMALIIAGLSNIKRIRNAKENLWLSLFVGWAIAVYSYTRFVVGTNTLLNIFLGVALYLTATSVLDKEDTRGIFKAILFVCFLNAVYVAMQYFLKFDPIFEMRGQVGLVEPTGFFGIKANMGMYFAIAIPILAYFGLLVPLIAIMPIYLGVSSITAIAAPVAWIFYTFKVKKWLALVVAPLVLAAGVLYIVQVDNPMGMQNTRPGMWKHALRIGLMRPVTGWGLDSFRNMYRSPITKEFLFMSLGRNVNGKAVFVNEVVSEPTTKQPVYLEATAKDLWDNAHCEVIQLVFEMGIVGLVLMILFLKGLVLRFIKAVKTKELMAVTASLVALLIITLTQFPLHLSRIAHLVPILLALFIIHTERDENSNDNGIALAGA